MDVPGSFSDAIDTYYDYILTRIAGINPARVFGGITSAESWPPPTTRDGALYLVVQNAFPVGFKSRGNQQYRHPLQWTWITQGSNLTSTQQGQNRGARFRLDQQIRGELTQANFPGFCPLISVSLDGNNNFVRTQYNPVQTCRWSTLSFGPRPSVNDDSGTLYGAAAVDVIAFQQPLTQ